MFTGRWPHELAIQWSCPLNVDVPTLAEHLGSLGYATAGFAGNTFYCSYDSGLDRGFTHYRDYVLDKLNAARTVRLVNESLKTIGQLGRFLPIPGLTLLKLTDGERKDADVVNREFLDWLSRRQRAAASVLRILELCGRPFALLAPAGGLVPLRFERPRPMRELRFLAEDWTQADKRRLPPAALKFARDAYDNCLAYMDERLGELIDDLQRRGVLDQTLVIVTADHGEGLGEHGLFDHGESLYRTEIRVPLLIVLPADRGRSEMRRPRVRQPARPAGDHRRPDRPGAWVAVPGPVVLARSLAGPPTGPPEVESEVALSELASPNPSDPNQGRSPAYRGPLISLAEGDFVYIRNEGDGSEELFNLREDPDELKNLARAEATASHLAAVSRPRSRRRRPMPRPSGIRGTASVREHQRSGVCGAALPGASRIPSIGAFWASDGNS